MSDTKRTRGGKSLADVLGRQLRAAAEEGVPSSRHFVEGKSAARRSPDTGDSVDAKVDPRDVRLDDMPALIQRSFDFEATEWLLQHMAAPTRSRTH